MCRRTGRRIATVGRVRALSEVMSSRGMVIAPIGREKKLLCDAVPSPTLLRNRTRFESSWTMKR